MSYRGHIKDGKVVLDEPANLPEGTEVTIAPAGSESGPPAEGSQQTSTLYDRMKPFIGVFKGLPPDASVNHDHYLYGTPKRK